MSGNDSVNCGEPSSERKRKNSNSATSSLSSNTTPGEVDDCGFERRLPPKKRRVSGALADSAPTAALAGTPQTAALAGGPRSRPAALVGGPRWQPVHHAGVHQPCGCSPATSLLSRNRRPFDRSHNEQPWQPQPQAATTTYHHDYIRLINPSRRVLAPYRTPTCSGSCATCATCCTRGSAACGASADCPQPGSAGEFGLLGRAGCQHWQSSTQGVPYRACETQLMSCRGAPTRLPPTRLPNSCRVGARAATTRAAAQLNTAYYCNAPETCGGDESFFVQTAAKQPRDEALSDAVARGWNRAATAAAATAAAATAAACCGMVDAPVVDVTTPSRDAIIAPCGSSVCASTRMGNSVSTLGTMCTICSHLNTAQHTQPVENPVGFTGALQRAMRLEEMCLQAEVQQCLNGPIASDTDIQPIATVGQEETSAVWIPGLLTCIEGILKTSTLRQAIVSKLVEMFRNIICGFRLPVDDESEPCTSKFCVFAKWVTSWFGIKFTERSLSAGLVTYLNEVLKMALQQLRRNVIYGSACGSASLGWR